MKKYLFGILAIGMAIGFSAFNTHKPFTPKDYYFVAGTSYQRLLPGVTTGALIEQSLQSSTFTNTAKWQESDPGITVTGADLDDYIGKINISAFETASDGSGDGEISLQEAINAVWASYVAPESQNPPQARQMQSTVSVGSVTVTVTPKVEATE